MQLPSYPSQAIQEMARPYIRIIRDENVPRDQTIIVSAEAGGPAILANSWMVIELENTLRGGRRIDPDAWFAEILAKIDADARITAEHAIQRLA